MGCGQLGCKQERKEQLRFPGTTGDGQRMCDIERLYETGYNVPLTSHLDQVARTDAAQ